MHKHFVVNAYIKTYNKVYGKCLVRKLFVIILLYAMRVQKVFKFSLVLNMKKHG
ncbi:hypothetical protein ALCH109712_03580 [Alkalicoccus chagannorensis]